MKGTFLKQYLKLFEY